MPVITSCFYVQPVILCRFLGPFACVQAFISYVLKISRSIMIITNRFGYYNNIIWMLGHYVSQLYICNCLWSNYYAKNNLHWFEYNLFLLLRSAIAMCVQCFYHYLLWECSLVLFMTVVFYNPIFCVMYDPLLVPYY